MKPEDHKTLAIVSLVLSILCCSPIAIVLAIISLVKANKVNELFAMGNQFGALEASKNAKLFGWIAVGFIVLSFVLNGIFAIYSLTQTNY